MPGVRRELQGISVVHALRGFLNDVFKALFRAFTKIEDFTVITWNCPMRSGVSYTENQDHKDLQQVVYQNYLPRAFLTINRIRSGGCLSIVLKKVIMKRFHLPRRMC
jgi:hypothetical protein